MSFGYPLRIVQAIHRFAAGGRMPLKRPAVLALLLGGFGSMIGCEPRVPYRVENGIASVEPSVSSDGRGNIRVSWTTLDDHGTDSFRLILDGVESWNGTTHEAVLKGVVPGVHEVTLEERQRDVLRARGTHAFNFIARAAWRRAGDLPWGREGPTALVLGGKLVVAGGYSDQTVITQPLSDELAPGGWQRFADDLPSRGGQIGAISGSLVYAGGFNNAPYYAQDPSSHTIFSAPAGVPQALWSPVGQLETVPGFAAYVSLGNAMVIAGGTVFVPTADGGYSLASDRVYVLNADTTSRSVSVRPLPSLTTSRWGTVAASVGARVYVFGGGSTPGEVLSLDIVSPTAWRMELPMPAERAFAGATAVGQCLIVSGGYSSWPDMDQATTFVGHIDASTGAIDGWKVAAPLGISRSENALTSGGNDVFAVGGVHALEDSEYIEVTEIETATFDPENCQMRENVFEVR